MILAWIILFIPIHPFVLLNIVLQKPNTCNIMKYSVAVYICLFYYIIPHLKNSFLFQCYVTQSLIPYKSPEQAVY